MGWFQNLFGRRDANLPSGAPPLPAASSWEGRLFTLDRPKWFGLFSVSPNGRWLISWRDSDPSSGTGGYRKQGKGGYLLYDISAKRVVLQGHLERPNNGHVANNGSFVLEDWHFGDELSGTLHGFDAQGHSLLKRKFAANLVNSAISPNGRYAVGQTANSSSEDAVKLFLFDLATGGQRFAVPPRAGWAMDYTVDEERVEVIAHLKTLGAFRYDARGDFLDEEALEEASLTKGDYSTVIRVAEGIAKREGVSPGRLRDVLAAVVRARHQGADGDRGWAASALKVQGFIHESLGQTTEAMTLYQQALDINPKIGLKRKLVALQKSVGHVGRDG